MKGTLSRCAFARVMASAVALALVPLPALAGETGPAVTPGASLTASISSAAAREAVAALRPAAMPAQARQGSAGNPDLSTWRFFKTPLGIGVAVLLVAGTGYALYSMTDKGGRIRAPGR